MKQSQREVVGRFWPFAILLMACFATVASGQVDTGAVSGEVVDASGARITAARVILQETSTGIENATSTNSVGSFFLPSVKPGQYRLSISKEGFASTALTHIVINVGDQKNLAITLKVGQMSESVTVDAGGLTLNTTDGSVGTVVDHKFVENIPLNGRSFQDLIAMTPGVVTQSPQTTGQTTGFNGDFSVDGQRTESNYYSVDGVTGNTNPGDGNGAFSPANSGALASATALGTTQSLISVDALQEFKVLSSTYSAEYGRTPGGQFSLVTRSGSSTLHGTVFDYLRNNFFDANDWFNDHYGDPITPLRQNDFGGTFSGPVWIPKRYDGTNRTFFFLSYEGLRLTQPQAATILYVPDMEMRQQAPAALQSILNAYPEPNGQDYGTSDAPSLAEFIKSYSLPSQIDSTSVRFDHTFNPNFSAFFRYGHTPSFIEGRTLSAVSEHHASADNYTAGLTNQISMQSANEFRLGYANTNSISAAFLDGFGGAAPINLGTTLGIGASATTYSIFELYLPAIGASELGLDNAANHARQWNVTDSLSVSIGHHQMKFGTDYLHVETPTTPPSPFAESLFESTKAVLANQANLLYVSKALPVTPTFDEIATFAQDEWHSRPDLTLSFGLRWEVDPPLTEAHGNDPYTLEGSLGDPATLSLAPQGTPLWNTTWFNIAPRLGAAWTARSTTGWETILRGGGGVFFDSDNREATQGFSGIGFNAYKEYVGVPVPITSPQLNFEPSANPPYTGGTIYAFPPHLQLPYTLEWSASIEQALGRAQALTLSYVGSNARKLMNYSKLNLESLNPNFGTIIYINNGLTSNYQGLQVQFQRSMSHGLQALASYTWSHSLDYGSDDLELQVVRGNSDFDVRNNFQGGVGWELPNTQWSKVSSALLNRWGLDARVMARTGFPVTLTGNLYTDSATGNQYYGTLNLDPSQPVYLRGSIYPGGRRINPAAFSLPVGNELGNAPRNFVRGFGASQINLAARREIQLRENFRLQFRAETFNLFNRPNFGFIEPTLTNAQFGMATQTLNSSLGTVSSLYQQGGPRSMQFALKLLF